jgi:hypothetical protein
VSPAETDAQESASDWGAAVSVFGAAEALADADGDGDGDGLVDGAALDEGGLLPGSGTPSIADCTTSRM